MDPPLLSHIRNIPVTSAALCSLYPEVKTKWKKVELLEKDGEVIRLKRNLYVVNPKITGIKLSLGLIANHLLAPSYVSMSTALRHYGLIPEAVYTTQSMTFKPAKTFETPIGFFSFTHIDRDVYPIGLVQVKENDVTYVMASPEKALCDLIANTPGLHLRYQKEAMKFLEEDIRFDMEKLHTLDKGILTTYAKTGKKASSVQTILKLLDNE